MRFFFFLRFAPIRHFCSNKVRAWVTLVSTNLARHLTVVGACPSVVPGTTRKKLFEFVVCNKIDFLREENNTTDYRTFMSELIIVHS